MSEVLEDRFYSFEKQEVAVENFYSTGYILDIGGGGEGIIGKWKGKAVVAIDPCIQELEEAPAGPVKIVMDAKNLQFLNNTFNVVTSFFTLMYIRGIDHQTVFQEVSRVLIPTGSFLIWDVNFPKRPNTKKDIAVFPLIVKLPSEKIFASYGVVWSEKRYGLEYYTKLAENTGFNVVSSQQKGFIFSLKLQKPDK